MKRAKLILLLSLIVYGISFFLPSYLMHIFGSGSPVAGWQCFLYSLTGFVDSFNNDFNLSLFLSGLFALVADICIIIGVVAILTKSRRNKLLFTIGMIGIISTLWWLVHGLYEGGVSNLLIGYYTWIAGSVGILFSAYIRARHFATDKRNSYLHNEEPSVPSALNFVRKPASTNFKSV